MVSSLHGVIPRFGRRVHDESAARWKPFIGPKPGPICPDSASTSALFADWMRYTFQEETSLSADVATPHHIWEEVRDELLNPADMTNQATGTQTTE